MLVRIKNPWRVLSATAVFLVISCAPSLASATPLWRTSLVHQDAVAALNSAGHAGVSFSVFTGGVNGDDDAVDVSLYGHLTSRSQLEAIYNGQGISAQPIASTGSFPLNCRTRGVAHFKISLGESSGTAKTTCGGAQPFLSLNCRGQSCDGVYPVALHLTNGRSYSTIWTLVTVTSSHEVHPLALCWIFATDPVTSATTVNETKALATLARYPASNFTIGANYTGLNNVTFDTSSVAVAYRTALSAALASSNHDLANAPPTSIDFAALQNNGLLADAASQAHMASNLVNDFTAKQSIDPIVLSGAVTPKDLNALAKIGIRQVVLPDASLTLQPSTTLQWGTPFYLSGATSHVVALSTDAELRRLVQDRRITPGLRSALVVGTLGLLHYEAPFAPSTRVAIIDSPLAELSPRMLSDLLSALRHDPLVTLSNLSSRITASLAGSNGYPISRKLSAKPAASWTSANVKAMATLDANLRSYAESITSVQPIVPLQVGRLLAERRGSSSSREHVTTLAQAGLAAQLSTFRIDSTTITLTGTGTPLPITVTSHAPYSVHGFLSLSAPNVQFPEGSIIPISLTSSTTAIRIPANVTGPGNFTLGVKFISVDRRLIFANGAIQVRSTATSFLGFVLTLGSLFVIAAWWWRTTRRQSKGQHAA